MNLEELPAGSASLALGRASKRLVGFPGPGRSFWIGLGWDRS